MHQIVNSEKAGHCPAFFSQADRASCPEKDFTARMFFSTPGSHSEPMSKPLSLYLDLVRLLAAVIVMVYHFAYARFSGGGLQFIRDSHIGSDAVITFFVLSGFVIAYVTASHDKEIKTYLINRLSRLWSVVIPALILTIVADQLGRAINPAAYDGWWYQADSPIIRILANVLFVNEIWFETIRPFTNGPFWSLSYEFWYYVIFGALFYFRGALRIALVLAAMLIAGPKILLLWPIWMLGVFTWMLSQRITLSASQGVICFFLPFVIYVMIKVFAIDHSLMQWTAEMLNARKAQDVLGFSDEFLISYVYGGLIAMNFLGFQALAPHLGKALAFFEKPIRAAAGLTFSIYLFHYPLFQFFSAVLDPEMNLLLRNCTMFLGSLLIIIVVGQFSERKKPFFRKQLQRLSARL